MESWKLNFDELDRWNTASEWILIERSAWPWWRRSDGRPYIYTAFVQMIARKEVSYMYNIT